MEQKGAGAKKSNDEEKAENVWERIGRLEERLEKSESSYWKKFSFYGALVALILSIFSGIYNVYEVSVLRPAENELEQMAKLSDFAFKINAMQKQLQAAGEDGNSDNVFSARKELNLIQAPMLSEAREILQNEDLEVKVPTLLLFAGAFSYTEIDFSKHLIQKAIEKSTKNYEMAEALAAQGQMFFFDDMVVEGRKTFERALDQARASNPAYRADVVVDVLTMWSMSEQFKGNCEKAKALHDSITSETGLGADDQRVRVGLARVVTYSIKTKVCSGTFD